MHTNVHSITWSFAFLSGSKYIGEWLQDLKDGKGKFVFQSGQVFEGEFRADKMIGDGSRGAQVTGRFGLLRPQTPLGSLIGKMVNFISQDRSNIRVSYTFKLTIFKRENFLI